MFSTSSSLTDKSAKSKRNVTEKIVQIYAALFRNEDPSVGNKNFWDEFFLLRVNSRFLKEEISAMSGERLGSLRPVFSMLYKQCVRTLCEDHPLRVNNALLTLSSLTHVILTRTSSSFDVINILIGLDDADVVMKNLVDQLIMLLQAAPEQQPPHLKHTILFFLLLIVTSRDNLNENSLLEYLMINCVFEALIGLISDSSGHPSLANKASTLLALLVQYRKTESVNPYIVKLSILDDELALTGLAHVISSDLFKSNQQFSARVNEVETTGLFASLSNMVGNMLIGEESKVQAFKANDSLLLSLYETLHLNRNFNTTLSHSHTELSTALSLETNTANQGEGGASTNHIAEPTNLLGSFLEYCSIISQDVRDASNYNSTKLCLIILTCMVEDQSANCLMHDTNLNFKVTLHRLSMRHRKNAVDSSHVSRPLVCSLIDLMVEFIMSHLMKNFPMELHMRCLGIVHRVVCYEKKCRLRLKYQWSPLWNALIHLLKYVVSNESSLLSHHNIFLLCNTSLNLLNLFITYGDTFLCEPDCYDHLYYELIRNHVVFENLHSICLRHASKSDTRYKDSVSRMAACLVNVRAIISHFSPKLHSFASSHQVASLTNDEVLQVVRNNYDSLTLRMHDCIDQFNRHSERPSELSSFFNSLVREIVRSVRNETKEELFKS